MFKNSLSLLLPLAFLGTFSLFSTKVGLENYTSQQYQLGTGEEITVANDTSQEPQNDPILPGDGRAESSNKKS